MVVSQLAERSLPTPVVRSLNAVIGNIYCHHPPPWTIFLVRAIHATWPKTNQHLYFQRAPCPNTLPLSHLHTSILSLSLFLRQRYSLCGEGSTQSNNGFNNRLLVSFISLCLSYFVVNISLSI